MKFMAWLWWTPILSVLALPIALRQAYGRPVLAGDHGALQNRDDRTLFQHPETGRILLAGETNRARTIYTLVSLFCAIVLALLLGLRAKLLRSNVFKKSNFTSILVLVLYFFALSFIFSATVVEAGQSLRTHRLCYSAAMICLVFYTGNKLTIYIFLLERARIVRSPFCPRYKDWLWISGMIIICAGFGSIAIVGYMSPIVELSPVDGKCRVGLPAKVSFPLLSFDIGVNFLLTGVFIFLLKPVLDYHGLLSMPSFFGHRLTRVLQREARRQQEEEDNDSQLSAMNKNIKTLLWKCLIGSTLVMLPTVGNMAQFYIMKGRELGWICLTICTLDVSWGVIIVNWLTIGSAEAEKNLTSLISQRTISTQDRAISLAVVRSRDNSVVALNQPPTPPPAPPPAKSVRIQAHPRELLEVEKDLQDIGPSLGPRRVF